MYPNGPDNQRVGSRVPQNFFVKYSELDGLYIFGQILLLPGMKIKYFWPNIVFAGNGNKLKLRKTLLFQISGSGGS